MDPKTIQILKEWRENMEQAQAMEFALVAEEKRNLIIWIDFVK